MGRKKSDQEPANLETGTKELVLTEKPSVARDIADALGGKKSFREHDGYYEGDRYLVSWAIGHLLEFLEPDDIDPAYKRWRLADLPILPEAFDMKPKPGQKARLSLLKKLANRPDVTGLINACDAGREGELIFREIRRYLKTGKPVLRLWLQSMTSQAIREGFGRMKPGPLYEGLGSAAEFRAESDWLIGINATRALTKRLQTRKETEPWSVGRVQTPTLALLVDRELEILAHRSRPYWRVKAAFAAADHEYEGWWFQPQRQKAEGEESRDDWIMDPQAAQAILERVRGKPGLAREERKPSAEKAPPPFDLTSLQREANRRFGYSASRTLDAAQQLYEKYKLLTYPRTDSRCLPVDYEPKAREVISTLAETPEYGEAARVLLDKGLQNRSRIFDDSGVTDHFAIMPTGLKSSKLPQGVGRVYDLVVRRFLAAFFPPALWENIERVTVVEGEHFRTRARILQQPGWQFVFEREVADQQKLPLLGQGDVPVSTLSAEVLEEEVKPPSRISEAGLLRLMENAGKQIEDEELSSLMRDKGLGTPATRAEIIENLIGRKYVRRVGKSLGATPKAIRLIDILRRIQVDRLASAEMTGEMEYHLRQLERGERSRESFNDEIREYTRQIVDRVKAFAYEELYAREESPGPCPVCKTRRVVEDALAYRCEGADQELCGFRLWKEKQGRYLDRSTVETLLKEGRTPLVPGFFSREGKPYSAFLELDAAGVTHVRLSEQPDEELHRALADTSPLGNCPVCGENQVFQTPRGYACSGVEQNKCSFKLPASLCRREIAREEAQAFLKEKRTGVLEGFVSRKGRPFRATLSLNEQGRIEWSFPKRESARGNGADAPPVGEIVDPESLGVCPLCKQGKVLEAENAYVCREGGEGCAFVLPRTLLGREIQRAEAAEYVLNGKTEVLEGFISQRGRPFRAALIRKKNGKYGYQFPDRGRRASRS